ncbi:MAG: hypothetical protein ACR2QF_11940 [Geminicoccaceae bacterium]
MATKHKIEIEVKGCPSSDLNEVVYRKRRDAAANLVEGIAYDLIEIMSWLDTEAGHRVMHDAERVADAMRANPVAPGHAVEHRSIQCGHYALHVSTSNQ